MINIKLPVTFYHLYSDMVLNVYHMVLRYIIVCFLFFCCCHQWTL